MIEKPLLDWLQHNERELKKQIRKLRQHTKAAQESLQYFQDCIAELEEEQAEAMAKELITGIHQQATKHGKKSTVLVSRRALQRLSEKRINQLFGWGNVVIPKTKTSRSRVFIVAINK